MNARANFLFLDHTAFFGLVENPNKNDHSTIEIMISGEWLHGAHGDVDLGFKLMDAIRRNFEKFNMAGRIPVDFNHGSEMEHPTPEQGKAAGFVQKLIIVGNKGAEALHAIVKWTEEGARRIRAGEYKLISPAFQGNYKHPHAKKYIGPWLHSVALTNRPFLKTRDGGMQPVALSEEAARHFNRKEDSEMEFETIEINGTKFRVAKEDAESFKKLMGEQAATTKKLTEAAAGIDKQIEKATADAKAEAKTETDELKKKLTDAAEKGDQSAIITLLSDSVKALNDRVEKAEKSNEEQAIEYRLKDAVRKHKLSKAEADSDAWKKAATDPVMFNEMIKNKPAVVPTKPEGGDGGSSVDAQDQVKAFNALTTKRIAKLKEDGVDLSSGELLLMAQNQIADENTEMADAVFGV